MADTVNLFFKALKELDAEAVSKAVREMNVGGSSEKTQFEFLRTVVSNTTMHNYVDTFADRSSIVAAFEKTLKVLVDAGVDLEAKDEDGRTILLYACNYRNRWPCVEALLKLGADPTATTSSSKRTALHVLSYREHWKEGWKNAAKKLVEAGAETDARDFEGKTALHFLASSDANTWQIDFLLKLGADPLVTDDSGRTPFHVAGTKRLKNQLAKAALKRMTSRSLPSE